MYLVYKILDNHDRNIIIDISKFLKTTYNSGNSANRKHANRSLGSDNSMENACFYKSLYYRKQRFAIHSLIGEKTYLYPCYGRKHF